MDNDKRVAVVTGANRGIGLEICRQLAAMQGMQVILTARDIEKGHAASRELASEGHEVDFLELDVTSTESIHALTMAIKQNYGRWDILVNNAGVLLDSSLQALNVPVDVVRRTLSTNLIGPLQLSQEAIPVMRAHNYGRIVNISSGMGALESMEGGYPSYRLSKVGLNALTRILDSECEGMNILINSMCPGWVHTDMGGPNAPLTVAQGADTAVWLATLEDDGPRGGFFRKRKEIRW